jgi:hypothetical protein
MAKIPWHIKVVAVLFLAFPATRGVHATVPSPPPLNPETVVGMWEAVDPESEQLYVLSVRGLDPSQVSLVSVVGTDIPTAIFFRATQIRLDKAGHLHLVARGGGAHGLYSAEARLSGTADVHRGLMRGTLAVGPTKVSTPPNGGPVLFTRTEVGFSKWVAGARALAEKVLVKAAAQDVRP